MWLVGDSSPHADAAQVCGYGEFNIVARLNEEAHIVATVVHGGESRHFVSCHCDRSFNKNGFVIVFEPCGKAVA